LGDNAAGKFIGYSALISSLSKSDSMVFEHIEKLKRAFTDKYVVVDATRPELARFRNATGLVKTINMSGRALVEFDQFDNTGWYDIELDFLKVVPKPESKPTEEKQALAKKPAEKAAGDKNAAAPKAAAAKPAAAAGGKPSTADILAAARVKKGTGEPVAAKAAAPVAAAAAKPAAPKAAPGGKMSTAEILAMARGKGATSAGAAAPAAKPAKPTVKPEPEPAALTPVEAEEPVAEAAPVVEPAKPIKQVAAGPKPTTIAEKIAYCRKVDAK
jgi:hypothetical protein